MGKLLLDEAACGQSSVFPCYFHLVRWPEALLTRHWVKDEQIIAHWGDGTHKTFRYINNRQTHQETGCMLAHGQPLWTMWSYEESIRTAGTGHGIRRSYLPTPIEFSGWVPGTLHDPKWTEWRAEWRPIEGISVEKLKFQTKSSGNPQTRQLDNSADHRLSDDAPQSHFMLHIVIRDIQVLKRFLCNLPCRLPNPVWS